MRFDTGSSFMKIRQETLLNLKGSKIGGSSNQTSGLGNSS
jgi:hypothetical protein